MIDSILGIVSVFNANPIWGGMQRIGQAVMFLIPLVFLFGAAHAYFKEAKANVTGGGDLKKAMASTFMPMLALAGYSFLGVMIFEIIQLLDKALAGVGSFSALKSEYANTVIEIEARYKENESIIDSIVDMANAPLKGATYLLFLGSFLLLAFVQIGVNLGFAILCVFLYGFGFFAIASGNQQENFDVEKGFGKTLLTVFIYIIVRALIYWLLILVVESISLSSFLAAEDGFENAMKSRAYGIFSFINLLVVAVEVVSIWVATSLANNQPALMPVMAPFAAAGAVASQMFKDRINNSMMSQMQNVATKMPLVSHALDKANAPMGAAIRDGANSVMNAGRSAVDALSGMSSANDGGNIDAGKNSSLNASMPNQSGSLDADAQESLADPIRGMGASSSSGGDGNASQAAQASASSGGGANVSQADQVNSSSGVDANVSQADQVNANPGGDANASQAAHASGSAELDPSDYTASSDLNGSDPRDNEAGNTKQAKTNTFKELSKMLAADQMNNGGEQ